ncbi:MAG: Flp family type IVb pilin [Parvularculaceae bacterium]
MTTKSKIRKKGLRSFFRDESGATAIEYGLIVALIFLAIVTGVKTFATRTSAMYNKIETNLSNP